MGYSFLKETKIYEITSLKIYVMTHWSSAWATRVAIRFSPRRHPPSPALPSPPPEDLAGLYPADAREGGGEASGAPFLAEVPRSAAAALLGEATASSSAGAGCG
ncbi:hypothetical protein ACQJBY_018438 [Aegilops geniculata]